MARTFREIIAQNVKPETQLVLWLEPTDKAFKLKCYKHEHRAWVPIQTEVTWEEILNKPGSLESEETFKEAVLGALVADEVGFHYDGDVSAITVLANPNYNPNVIKRKYDWGNGGEEVTMASVDTILETIIKKVWFVDTTVTAGGYSGNLYVDDKSGTSGTATFTVKNYHGLPTSGMTLERVGNVPSISPSAITNPGNKTYTVSIPEFTPTRGQQGVKITVVTKDSNGVAATKTALAVKTAYYPYYAWGSETQVTKATLASSMKSVSKAMLTGTTFSFPYKAGKTLWYNILVPFSVTEATQGLKGDWSSVFNVGIIADSERATEVKVGGRTYLWYQSRDAVASESTQDLTVMVTLSGC